MSLTGPSRRITVAPAKPLTVPKQVPVAPKQPAKAAYTGVPYCWTGDNIGP